MRLCPRCHSKYPAGISECPSDGTALVDVQINSPFGPEPTEDLAASAAFADAPPAPSYASSVHSSADSVYSHVSQHTGATMPTSAEGPNARNRTRESGPPPALADGSAPPESLPVPPSKRRRRRDSKAPQESIGRVLGNYRLLDLIGRGGMGWVYRAEHVKLGREVALKLLRPEYSERRDSVARFFQEARAVNTISHRNIVDITDFVELGDGTTFIIMELLRGASLRDLAKDYASLTTPRVLSILVQICDALGAAHAVGIVHRDMKPDNVFIANPGDGSDVVKLLDFGVAKLIRPGADDDMGWETKAGSVIGTPAYMSPEQAGGLQVDGRSDLYSVGAIMYELFCGEPLFRARSFGEYVRKHLNEQPAPPRSTAGGSRMSERLEQLILRCLHKSPDARYQSMQDLQRDLLDVLGVLDTGMFTPHTLDPSLLESSGSAPSHPSHGHSSQSHASHAPSVQMPPTHVPVALPTARAPVQRGRLPLFALGTAALGAMAGLAFFLAASGDDPTAPPAQTPRAPATVTAPPAANRGPVISSMSPAASAKANLITVRFTSDPSGASVRPVGGGALCATPCDVSIDPATGASEYVVQRKGYRTEQVAVDLSAPPESRHVDLRRDRRDRPDRNGRADEDDDPPEDVVGSKTPPDPATGEPDPAVPSDPPDPTGPGRIDPEDTLDPFRHK